jgi:hypothetical protein
MIKNRYRSVSFLTLAALAAGCSAGAAGTSAPEEPTSPRASTVTSSTEFAPRDPAKEQWRHQMSKAPPTKEGCYDAVHPSMEWVEVPCATGRHTPPPHPQVTTRAGSPAERSYPGAVLGPVAPELGRANAEPSSKAPEGALAGAGTIRPETSGTVSSGTISWAEGSFPTVKGLTSETYNGTSNDFSLQLNTQSNFTNSAVAALCKSTATPSSCTGWVQFVYWQGAAEIWYNLINTGSTCPSGWSNQSGGCYREAPNTAAISTQAITNLPNMTLTGVAGGTTDTVIVTTGPGQLHAAVNTSLLNLSPEWTYADFNVLGNGSYGSATFNTGTTLGVQLLTDSATGNTSAPTCGPYNSTTGEGNDLSFVTGSCCTFGGDVPGILFTESNASSPTAIACPAGLSNISSLENLPPSIFVRSTGEADIVEQGPSNSLVYRFAWPGTAWSSTTIAGAGTTFSAPSIYVRSSGEADIVYQGPNNSLVYAFATPGSAWTVATIAGAGTTFSAPSIYVRSTGEADIVAEGPGNSLIYYFAWPGTAWSSTQIAGARSTFSRPSIFVRSTGEADVVAEGSGNSLMYYFAWPGTAWSHTEIAGAGSTFSAPSVFVRSTGEADVVAQGADASLQYYFATPGSSWTNTQIAPDGSTLSAPSIFVRSTGEADVVAEGPNASIMYYYAWPGTAWSSNPIGSNESAFAPPTVFVRSSGEADVVSLSTSTTMNYFWATPGSAWSSTAISL